MGGPALAIERSLMPKRILVVDDEKAITFAIASYFRHRGFAVDAATDPAQASRMIASNDYALAIVDLRLSGSRAMDGLDLAARIRERNAATPVILMTANGSKEVEREAERVGISSLVYKPKPLAEVAQIADQLLDPHAQGT